MMVLKCCSGLKFTIPFETSHSSLHSLCSGLASSDDDHINCDSALAVGTCKMKKMDDKSYGETVLKKADEIKSLSDLTHTVSRGCKNLNIDASVLFSRLMIIMNRSPEIEYYFSFELTPQRASLFKDGFMRKSDKSHLKAELLKGVSSIASTPVKSTSYVVDGGHLLHAVKWLKSCTYADVAQQYVSYLSRNYAVGASVVFDGYGNGPSIKDHEHKRRSFKCSPDVTFSPNMMVYGNQSMFLSNEGNKQVFVSFLMSVLTDSGYVVYQASDDADTLIVSTALNLAKLQHSKSVTVVANDTDILVLLVYHFTSDMADVYMMSKVFSRTLSKVQVIPICEVCMKIGCSAVQSLLGFHAISGCDTTSMFFGHGKRTLWKKFSKSTEALKDMSTLTNSDANQAQVVQAGSNLVKLMYEGAASSSLNKLRYKKYMEFTGSSNQLLRPERLPPAERAAYFHSLRAHLQAVMWHKLSTLTSLDPSDWGWQLQENHLIPIATDIEAAPKDLINVVRCNCRIDTKSPCSSLLCSCRKVGLSCVASCGHCGGTECDNPSPSFPIEDCGVEVIQ